MKQVNKRFLRKEHKEYQALVEKEVLAKLNHPSIVELFYTFQDKDYFYFIMEYIEGGTLSFVMDSSDLTTKDIAFYIA